MHEFVSMIPESLWAEFRKHRIKLKAPMTEYAERLILAKLERWEKEGANPVDILEESIIRGWAGVFLNGHGRQAGQRLPNAASKEAHAAGLAPVCCSCGKSLDSGFVFTSKGRRCHEC